jgi:predicted regulator of Ras-like GTPase activity (Roadblock/LC7/MglB family)
MISSVLDATVVAAMGTRVIRTSPMYVCLLLEDLVQSSVRGERGNVKDMC